MTPKKCDTRKLGICLRRPPALFVFKKRHPNKNDARKLKICLRQASGCFLFIKNEPHFVLAAQTKGFRISPPYAMWGGWGGVGRYNSNIYHPTKSFSMKLNLDIHNEFNNGHSQ